jgi:hypothetical protein
MIEEANETTAKCVVECAMEREEAVRNFGWERA